MKPDFSQIRLVVFDVDGVLTDGSLHYGPEGEVMKVFHVRDGVGIKLLQDNNIPVAVISAKDSQPLAKRMDELGVKYFYPGSKDKKTVLDSLLSELAIAPGEVAYVGDDMVDLPVMREVGVSLAPSDAYALVKNECDWVLALSGGQGVAREVADLVLGSKFELSSIYEQATKPDFERKRD